MPNQVDQIGQKAAPWGRAVKVARLESELLMVPLHAAIARQAQPARKATPPTGVIVPKTRQPVRLSR